MRTWGILIVLVVGLLASYNWMSGTPTEHERENLKQPLPEPKDSKLKKATMTPGRVVELHTNRGEIDFVLFEKDCPKTASRIAELAQGGSYDGTKFGRVETNALIQSDECKTRVAPIGMEVLKGLMHEKGAVGMARATDPNSATSSFYILMQPLHDLDYDYTVFGRVIKGMDVVMSIKKGDAIKRARVRPMTPQDEKRFHQVLQIEAECRHE